MEDGKRQKVLAGSRRQLSAIWKPGYRRLYSTETCFLKVIDDWYTGVDPGQMLGMVFVDLKKAFDTVNHCIICSKLKL